MIYLLFFAQTKGAFVNQAWTFSIGGSFKTMPSHSNQWINMNETCFLCGYNESMNQWNNESMNQWNNESMNQWINESMNQWINEYAGSFTIYDISVFQQKQ